MTGNRLVAVLLTVVLIGVGALESRASDPSPDEPGSAEATATAVVSDVFYVPGKAVFCGVSGVLWVATMALTFGALYDEAADLVKGGCGGRWVLTGKDFKPRSRTSKQLHGTARPM